MCSRYLIHFFVIYHNCCVQSLVVYIIVSYDVLEQSLSVVICREVVAAMQMEIFLNGYMQLQSETEYNNHAFIHNSIVCIEVQ